MRNLETIKIRFVTSKYLEEGFPFFLGNIRDRDGVALEFSGAVQYDPNFFGELLVN